MLATVPMVASWRKRNRAVVDLGQRPDLPGGRGVPVAAHLPAVRPAATATLRTLLVTSPAAAEGKTSTLANLGAVFAQAGERVVLVSCDLRRPGLGQFFGRRAVRALLGPGRRADAGPGAAAGAGRRRPVDARPRARSRRTPRNCSAAPRTADSRRRARASGFDLVLMDSPPVLPVTDAMILSKYADGVLLVVAAGQTRRAELRRAAERFAQASAPVVGVVLNKVTRARHGYGYGYGGYRPYVAPHDWSPVRR